MSTTARNKKGLQFLIAVLAVAVLATVLLLPVPPARAAAGVDYKTLYSTAGEDVYKLSSPGGVISSSALSGNTLVTVTMESWDSDKGQLAVLDLSTGIYTAELSLADAAAVTAGLLADGNVYTVNIATMEATIYDTSLHTIRHFEGREEYRYSSPFMTPDGIMLWCADSSGNSITGFSMEDGTVKHHECGFGGELYFAGFCGYRDGVVDYILSDGNGAMYLHSVRTKDMTTSLLPLPQGYNYMPGGLLYALVGSNAYLTRVYKADTILRMDALQEGEYPVACQGSLLAVQDMSYKAIRLYDLDANLYKGTFALPAQLNGFYFGMVLISENGFAIIPVDNDESGFSALYLWDYSAKAATESAHITTRTAGAFHLETEAQARDIAQKYGVGVLVYKEGAAFADFVYKGEVVWNDPATLKALDSLKSFLNDLPEGMLREMCVEPITHINIYLCGRIRRKSDEGILSAAAFTSTQGDERYVVVNLHEGYNLTHNLAHEFMHVMEDRIYRAGYEKGLDMAGYWLTLTPDSNGGAYAYSYKDANGNELTDTLYTGFDMAAENPDTVWFVDPYSRSFPIEDRARIFENLFAAEDEPPFFLTSRHMMEKAQYLCAMIRECFPSIAGQPLLWERFITPVPFEEYRVEVESYEAMPAG